MNNKRLVIICAFVLAAIALGMSFEELIKIIPILIGLG